MCPPPKARPSLGVKSEPQQRDDAARSPCRPPMAWSRVVLHSVTSSAFVWGVGVPWGVLKR